MIDRQEPAASAGPLPASPERSRERNRQRRWTLIPLGLACLLACSGCPESQIVQVTIKSSATAPDGAASDAAGSTEGAPAGYGNLQGTVTFDGSIPALKDLIAAGDASVKDASVCSAAAVPDESLIVDPGTKGLANVVIFLDKRPANVKPELAAPPTTPVMFDQKGCRFLPHVVTVQVGQPLLVVSDDGIPHNTRTMPKRNTSFSQVVKANERGGVACDYKKAESTPIAVACDFHPWMKAYHFPVDHPYVAITDQQGKFRIEGLPAGKHSFNVWHERGPGDAHLLERKLTITIQADQDVTHDLSYGAAKFAAQHLPVRRAVPLDRLQAGGEVIVSQRKGTP
ncbi:MAG: carboxypeptidase regulatory-like domain-containing protein [Planctomycetales bacterium]